MIRLKSLGKEWLTAHNRFYLSPLVCINSKPLSFITGNTNIGTHLPTSPPIAPVMNVSLVGSEMTVACEIPLNLFAIKLIFTFINPNLTADQIEGPAGAAVNFLQHPSPILTGSKSLYSISDSSLCRSSNF